MPATSTFESILELIGLLIIFVIVLVACYFVTRLVAGKQMLQKKVGNFEVIETFAISQNKYLQLVRMGNKYVVISVSKDAIAFVTELDESEVCRMQKPASAEGKSFKEILSSFTKEK